MQNYDNTPGSGTVPSYFYTTCRMEEDHNYMSNNPSGSEFTFDIDFPSAELFENANTITVENVAGGSITLNILLVNYFEIDYPDTYIAENDFLAFDGDSADTEVSDIFSKILNYEQNMLVDNWNASAVFIQAGLDY
ncbi:hypothetical protein JW979_10985 [bacterium]|nr:hypothetical protein [candidate division CSSED10-310 bacterium]